MSVIGCRWDLGGGSPGRVCRVMYYYYVLDLFCFDSLLPVGS